MFWGQPAFYPKVDQAHGESHVGTAKYFERGIMFHCDHSYMERNGGKEGSSVSFFSLWRCLFIKTCYAYQQGWQLLNSSRYNRHHLVLPQKEHGYCEGKQQIRPTRWRIASFDTSVFFWQNSKARTTWKVTNEVIEELRLAFQSKQAEERQTLGFRKGGQRVKKSA